VPPHKKIKPLYGFIFDGLMILYSSDMFYCDLYLDAAEKAVRVFRVLAGKGEPPFLRKMCSISDCLAKRPT
jgi:hypothetical protein